MRTPDATLKLAERAALATSIEIELRLDGQPSDPRFDAFIDYLADAAEAIQVWEWPGEANLRTRGRR